jgi:hypothetical protein
MVSFTRVAATRWTTPRVVRYTQSPQPRNHPQLGQQGVSAPGVSDGFEGSFAPSCPQGRFSSRRANPRAESVRVRLGRVPRRCSPRNGSSNPDSAEVGAGLTATFCEERWGDLNYHGDGKREPSGKRRSAEQFPSTAPAAPSASPVDLIDKALDLAQQCGGLAALKKLVDRLADMQRW